MKCLLFTCQLLLFLDYKQKCQWKAVKEDLTWLDEVLEHSSDEASSQLFTVMIKLMRELEVRKSRKLLLFITRKLK